MPENYFYHVRVMDMPDHEDYMKALALYRSIVDGSVTMEWFDPEIKEWEDAPELIAMTGLGGEDDYLDISTEDAEEVQAALEVGEKLLIELATEDDTEPDDSAPAPEEEGEEEEAVVEDIQKSLSVSPIFGIIRGGDGSGHYGHEGRPGEQGGSLPSGGGGKTHVGITSSRPGKAAEEVYEDMGDFEKSLRAIKTVTNVSVEPGTGGWEGGSEPTWVVSYEGNGEAMRLLAYTGQKFEQNAILVYEACKGSDCSPAVDWNFTVPLGENQKETIQSLLVENGIGGWTWYKTKEGLPVLRAVSIPQWGGEREAHLTAAEKISDSFDASGLGYDRSEFEVTPTIMEKEGDFAYSNYMEDTDG